MKKTVIIIVIVAVVCGVGGFFGGMVYGKSTKSSSQFARGMQDGGNFAADGQTKTGNRTGGNITNGEIISKDAKSITIKTADGSSKIVLFSGSTEVGKFTTTTTDVLNVGENVMVSASANSDGSLTAKSIQVRTAGQAVGGPDGGSMPGGNASGTSPTDMVGGGSQPQQANQ